MYFAAKEGLLGKSIKKIAIEMIREKKPVIEKKEEVIEKKVELPNELKPSEQIKSTVPKNDSPPTTSKSDSIVPPSIIIPSFSFEGGKEVNTTSDPIQIYKGYVEYQFKSKWNYPEDILDHSLVNEVFVDIDLNGRVSIASWQKMSGNKKWDDSIKKSMESIHQLGKSPPTNFPNRVLIRFDSVILQ